MLSGDYDGVNAHRLAVGSVFHCHLALRVRAKIGAQMTVGVNVGHSVLVATDFGQFAQQAVAQVERQRHVGIGLVAGIAEHHALVAGTLIFFILALNAAIDVGALLMKSREDATRFSFKLERAAIVADAVNNASDGFHQINIGFRLHFAGNGHMACGHKCFASNLRLRVAGKEFVENSVGNLVGYFIGVSFRYGFGCEQIVLLVGHSL